jgi:hypothetical protein
MPTTNYTNLTSQQGARRYGTMNMKSIWGQRFAIRFKKMKISPRVLLLLNVEDPLLLLDVGGDEVVQEEKGLGVRRHEDVVVEV